MKRQKDRFTANQLEQAIMDEVKQKRNLNIPANSISGAMAFADLITRRLCGDRTGKRAPGYLELIKDVIAAAQAERALEELKKQEEAKAQQSRIILPGRPRDPRAN